MNTLRILAFTVILAAALFTTNFAPVYAGHWITETDESCSGPYIVDFTVELQGKQGGGGVVTTFPDGTILVSSTIVCDSATSGCSGACFVAVTNTPTDLKPEYFMATVTFRDSGTGLPIPGCTGLTYGSQKIPTADNFVGLNTFGCPGTPIGDASVTVLQPSNH